MQSSDLKSKEWCDVVFEHRNREYGAYRLRQRAGARYRYALLVVLSCTLLLALGYYSYMKLLRYQRKNDLEEAEKSLANMIPSELNNGYQIKMVSTARLTPAASEGNAEKLQGVPVITDEVTRQMKMGVKKVIRFSPQSEWCDMEASDLATDSGTEAVTQLVKHKIIKTDDVSELPEFPGGARAFMRWLDANIIYPAYFQRRGIEGEVTVSFIIREDGYPSEFKVEKASHKLFEQTALNVLRRMPQWKPGKTPDGEPTPVMITIPITFKK